MTRIEGMLSRWSGVDTTTPFEAAVSGSGGSIAAFPAVTMPSVTKVTTGGRVLCRWAAAAQSPTQAWGGSAYGAGYTAFGTEGNFASPYNGAFVFGSAFETTPAAPGTITGATYTGVSNNSNAIKSYATRSSVLRGVGGASPTWLSSIAEHVEDSATPGSVSFNSPGATVSGNFLLVEFYVDNPNASVAGSSGWTKNYDIAFADGRMLSFYRFATTSGGGGLNALTLTITIPSGNPSNTVAPAVTGTAAVASVLTSDTGTWNQSGLTYAYQWQRNTGSGFVDLSGSTGSTYTVVSGDAGASLRCAVTATNTSSLSGTATSNTVVIPAAPVNTAAPVISPAGPYATGQTISVDTGTWTGTGLTIAYQWYRGTSPISGETNFAYTLAVTDEGANVSCRVTATNGGGSATANSNTIVPAVTAPISDASFLSYLSGGTGNIDPSVSYGGPRGGTLGATINNLFGPILGTVAQAGGTFYRVIYVRNTHTTATAASCQLFLEQQYDPTSGLTLSVAVPSQAVNTTVPALASGTTAPSGVTWTSATTSGGGRAFGNLGPGDYRGVYVRLVVAAGATPTSEVDAIIAVEGSAA